MFSIPILSIQMTGATLFQALGKAAPAIVFSLLRRITIYTFDFIALPRFTQLGLMGIWLSYPIADIAFCSNHLVFLRN